MKPIATVVSGRTKSGKREELLALFKSGLAPRAAANAAQQVVVWVADAADPDEFHLFEIYRDRDAMEANSKAEWFWADMAKAGPLLEGSPEVRTGEPRWSNGTALDTK